MRIFFIFAADSWWYITEIGDIQGVSYSCFFWALFAGEGAGASEYAQIFEGPKITFVTFLT